MSNLAWINIKYFRTEEELPTAIGWFIQLADWVKYILWDNLTITNKIKMWAGTTLEWNGLFGSTLTYAWTGSMISWVDWDCVIKHIQFDCPSAEVFNFVDSSTQISTILIDSVQVVSCDSWGTFQVLSFIQNNSNARAMTTSWITLTWANWLIVSIKEFFIGTTTDWFVFIDFWTSVHQNIEITNLVLLATWWWAAAIWISWLASSWNLLTWNIANVSMSSFLWNITPLSWIDENDIRWDFQWNTANVADTRIVAWMNIPTTQTVVITTLWVPVIVNDSNTGWTNIWSLKTARKFEFSASLGRLTYKWERPVYLNVAATATVEKVWGGADPICWFIAKNWTVVTDSKACTENSTPTSIPIQTWVDLVTDDYIEIAVQNDGWTADIIINLSNVEIF